MHKIRFIIMIEFISYSDLYPIMIINLSKIL